MKNRKSAATLILTALLSSNATVAWAQGGDPGDSDGWITSTLPLTLTTILAATAEEMSAEEGESKAAHLRNVRHDAYAFILEGEGAVAGPGLSRVFAKARQELTRTHGKETAERMTDQDLAVAVLALPR